MDSVRANELDKYEFEGFCCCYGSDVTIVKSTDSRYQFDVIVPFETSAVVALPVPEKTAVNSPSSQDRAQPSTISLCIGQMCIFSSEQAYRVQLEKPGEVMLIYLPVTTMVNAVQDVLRSPLWTLEKRGGFSDDVALAIATALKQWLPKTGTVASLYRRTLIELLSVHIVANYAQADFHSQESLSCIQDGKLTAAIQYIQDHIDEDLKIVTLAEVVGLSPSYFSRVFKRTVGISPRQYVLSERIRLAKTLLKDSYISLSAISFRCGFYDQSHFVLQFRRFTGTTPKAYRIEYARESIA